MLNLSPPTSGVWYSSLGAPVGRLRSIARPQLHACPKLNHVPTFPPLVPDGAQRRLRLLSMVSEPPADVHESVCDLFRIHRRRSRRCRRPSEGGVTPTVVRSCRETELRGGALHLFDFFFRALEVFSSDSSNICVRTGHARRRLTNFRSLFLRRTSATPEWRGADARLSDGGK